MYTSPDLLPANVTRALVEAGFEVARAKPVRRVLLDSFDGRLHAAGLRLEARGEGSGLELVLADDGRAPARVAATGVPRVVGELPAGPFRARLAPVLEVRALLPVMAVTARLTEAVRRDGTGKVRARVSVYDQLAVEGQGASRLAWAAEVGEMAGYAKSAEEARQLLSSLGLRPEPGDVIGNLAVAAQVDLRGFRTSPTVDLERGEPAFGAYRRVLANLAGAVDANWQGSVDDVDPEFLHDLRVGVRRTRSVLSQGRGVLPVEVRDRHREAFSWLGTATGPARDLDVYVIEWQSYVAPLGDEASLALRPVLDHITARRAAEHVALAKVLRSVRYRRTMAAWRAWLVDPLAAATAPEAQRAIDRVASGRIEKAQDRLVSRGRAITPATPAEDLHELRKDAKKLRYLLECFGGLYASAPRKVFVQRLKAVQDNLGEHQDAEVHVGQLRAMSAEMHGRAGVGAPTMVAMGQLTESLERRRRASREDFAERFATYDTKPTRRALRELLDS